MSYKIVIDSCGELTPAMKADGHFETISLQIQVDDHHMVDDDTFDQALFLRYVSESSNVPKSSCPSPEKYMESYNCDADNVYAITLSANLSGSYNSAVLGKDLYHEEYGEKNIYVFDSRSASICETLIGMKIQECEEAGMNFEQVIEAVEQYISEQNTYFVIEDLDPLKKNGRLSGVKAMVATALNIKPIMGATPVGTIIQLGQARGRKKAISKMLDIIIADLHGQTGRKIAISHCNCYDAANGIRETLLAKGIFEEVILVDTRGISSLYVAEGGIIMAV